MFSRFRLARLGWACLIFGIASCQWHRGVRVEDPLAEPSIEECQAPHYKSMMALAHDLDHIEKHIEWYGSVVPKVPDVWGQARLQKHREEFEQVMSKDLNSFEVRLNGAVNRADSSFAAQAVALGAAITGGGGAAPTTPTVNVIAQTPTPSTPAVTSTTGVANAVISTDAATQALISATGRFTIDPSKGSTTTAMSTLAIGLEPTIILEQKARYLNLLNQIRRTNEGDDTADSPGYSLNLMRIPVSLLPGQKTDEGWGGEITFTITPELSNELLPTTYRNLVVNDLIDQLGFPLAKILEDPTLQAELAADIDPNFLETYDKSTTTKSRLEMTKGSKLEALGKHPVPPPSLPVSKGVMGRSPFPNSQIYDVYGFEFSYVIAKSAFDALKSDIEIKKYAHLPDIQSFLQSEILAAQRLLMNTNNPQVREIWRSFCTRDLVNAVRNRRADLLADMRRNFRTMFQQLGTPQLDQVSLRYSVTAAMTWCILVDCALLTDRLVQDIRESVAAKRCACSIPIDDQRLPEFFLPNVAQEQPQLCAAFNDYVRCRWPIHVFALDPTSQDQNLADSLSTRRETQLTLALAFTSGRINANTLTRYSRRLEANYDTIALNRTQVGFSHGENTFGWRFYPRFQSPDTDSNLTIIVRDQWLGGPKRNALLRQRRLEPGPRECVAIVLMPSFVPNLKCESVSNWFNLVNPKHKAFDLAHAMRVSHSIKTLQDTGHTVKDAQRYRNGDHQLLLAKLGQLDSRMPTQSQMVSVPIINTLGGFKMFNNGATDFAPELYGFYGAPGVTVAMAGKGAAMTTSAPCTGVTLFLVGDHFSVNRTKVIVGNYECYVEMLSRQVLKVCVPSIMVEIGCKDVHAHVATPYGVSREIRIPVVSDCSTPPTKIDGYTLKPNSVAVKFTKSGNQYTYAGPKTLPVTINWSGDPTKAIAPARLQLVFDYFGQTAVPASAIAVAAFDKDGNAQVDVAPAIVDLLNQINKNAALGAPSSLTSIHVTITSTTIGATVGVEAQNQLSVSFKETSYAFDPTSVNLTYDDKGQISTPTQPQFVQWDGDPATAPKTAKLKLGYEVGGTQKTIASDTVLVFDATSGKAAIDSQLKAVFDDLTKAKMPLPPYLKISGTIVIDKNPDKATSNTLEISLKMATVKKDSDVKPETPKVKPKVDSDGRKPLNGDGPTLGQIKPASFTQDDLQWTNSKKVEVKKDVVFVPVQK